MKDRIKKIRANAGLTQEQFAEKLGLKRNTIATYESGKEPMPTVIVSICREFNINRKWLETGDGEMYKQSDIILDEYLAEISTGDDDFIKEMIKIYMELDQNSKDALKAIAKKMEKRRKGES